MIGNRLTTIDFSVVNASESHISNLKAILNFQNIKILILNLNRSILT
jgi:hypothetical protein